MHIYVLCIGLLIKSYMYAMFYSSICICIFYLDLSIYYNPIFDGF